MVELPDEIVMQAALAPGLKALGYGLARLKLTAGGCFRILHLTVERRDEKPLTVQDCVTVSHASGHLLKRCGLRPDSYTLEIAGVGAERVLVRVEDFERFAGRLAIVDLQAPIEGRQRFQGRIVRVAERGSRTEPELELHTPEGAVHVPFGRIARARLSAADER